jgi:hypothetical protein
LHIGLAGFSEVPVVFRQAQQYFVDTVLKVKVGVSLGRTEIRGSGRMACARMAFVDTVLRVKK